MELMTVADFLPREGKTFQVPLTDGSTLELRLVEIEAKPFRKTPVYWSKSQPYRNEPFDLTFQGPLDLRLPDGRTPMQDESGQWLHIDLSAIAENEEGIYYIAYFA